MSDLKGRLLWIGFEPGSELIGVTLLDDRGEEVGRYLKMPEHTFGAIMVDGQSIRSTGALILWVTAQFENESVIDVTLQMAADETHPVAQSAQFVRATT